MSASPSLAEKGASGLAVVLVCPEIPPNTGSVARLCAAARVPLHLIEPLGFSLEDRYLKRAGLDYWPCVDLKVHADWPAFLGEESPETMIAFSARSTDSYLDAPYCEVGPVYLVFGCETKGLPGEVLDDARIRQVTIPIFESRVRSHNLANAVSIGLYEGLRVRGVLANQEG